MHLNLVGNSFQNKKRHENQPSFSNGGAMLAALAKPLQSFDTNPIGGVIFLDITSAIAPNTAIDTAKRNPAQGFETFRRESSGLIVNCLLPGILVPFVALALKGSILGNAFSGIAAHRIWANKDTIDETAATWKKIDTNKSKQEKVKEFIQKSFAKIEHNADSKWTVKNAEVKQLHDETLQKLAEEIIKSDEKKVEIPRKTLNEIHGNLAKIYGQSKSISIKCNNEKTYSTSLKNYVRDTYALSKAYLNKSASSDIDNFAKKLKQLLKVKSAVTMIGVGALALSMQAINRKITEKMTGRKGYSGYKDLSTPNENSQEEKNRLKIGKLASSAWFTSLAFVSMGKITPGMVNFAAPTTTMNQARTLSLVTDVGRVNAADDKNELKDTTVRDSIIFMNLYVLGDYVQKGVVSLATKFNKKKYGDLNLMNEGKKLDKDASLFKKIGHWIKGKSVKSFEEIEGTAINHLEGEKITQLRKNIITASNLAGIGYSLVALGIFTPLYIARMTNNNRKKQLARAKTAQQNSINTKPLPIKT